jgi:hypothetical protein
MQFDLNYFYRVAEMNNRMMPERLIYLRAALAATMNEKSIQSKSDCAQDVLAEDQMLYQRRLRERNIAAYRKNLAA